MRILRVQAHNVLGVDDIDLDLRGHHLYLIGGRNGQGKTSAIRSVLLAICGKSGCDWPEEPVRNGAAEAWVQVDTDGCEEIFQKSLKIERRWERREDGTYREQFRVIGDDGFEAPEPQTLLKRLYKHRGFDPLSFLRMKPRDQVEELQRIVGLDFTQLNEERKTVYDQRTVINRQAKELETKYRSLPHYPEAPEEPLDVSELQEEFRRRDTVNRDNDAVRDELQQAEFDYQDTLVAIQKAENDVREIEELLDRKKAALKDCKQESAKAKRNAEKLRKLAGELQDENVEEIEQRILQSQSINAQVQANRDKHQLRDSWQIRVNEAKELTARIEDIDAEKARLLDEAPWPVDGLRYAEDGTLVLQGIPFSQASAAEKIRTSVAMGMAANPELRLLVIEHGECLDNDSLEIVEQVAKENGYTILVEFMTRDEADEERCQVVLEEGRVKVAEDDPAIAGSIG